MVLMQELGVIIFQMTLAKLLSLYKQKALLLITGCILGLLLGLLSFYYIPPKYIATGSFYTARRIETVPSTFSYEGYYASLASLNYAKTLTALIESDDMKSRVLKGLEEEVTRKGLRELDRAIRVVKTDSSLVTFQVKHPDPARVQTIWKLTSEELLQISSDINKNGDSKVLPVPVLESPVVYKGYSSMYFNAIAGAIAGLLTTMLLLGSFFYLKENNG